MNWALIRGEYVCGQSRDMMTQKPVGSIGLRTATGTMPVSFSDHNLYERSMRLFVGAVDGKGQPSATGTDGVKSLAVAMAVKQSAQTGSRIAVDYGGI